MPITRHFLDWNEPALPAAADWLIQQYAQDRSLNLKDVVVVMPGGRAGRRLLELLVERAELNTLSLIPPRIETMGRLPELLYEAKRPFASDIVQRLAWARALQQSDRDLVRKIITAVPNDDDVDSWLALGDLLWRQHRELAADGLDFADVLKQGMTLEDFNEQERWEILSQIQQSYLSTLDHLELWDLQTARLFAIANRECHADFDIVLVATADMNRAVRRMLDQVADRVTALIHAPTNLVARFDIHGCIAPEEWQDITIDLKTENVQVVDNAAAQAEAVVRTLAAYDGRYRADEITIGLADEQMVSQLQRQLTQCNIPNRWVVGTVVSETAPFRLLSALVAYLETRQFAEFAALVRHPDICRWLVNQHKINSDADDKQANDAVNADGENAADDGEADSQPRLRISRYLTQLDQYYSNHLPTRLGFWLGQPREYDQIKIVFEAVESLLAGLKNRRKVLGDWMDELLELLRTVYRDVSYQREDYIDQTIVNVFALIRSTLAEFTEIPELLAPKMTAAQAIRITLEQRRSAELPPPPDDQAIELLGWLELPLDDAPALVVTTFNERYVPTSLNSDLFLPNKLRRRLGVVDNARRYARDAYALSVLVASRESLNLIVARRDTRGDPLTPSRLLFATQTKSIPERVLAFYDPKSPETPPAPLAGTLQTDRQDSDFVIPRPERLMGPVERMTVTGFRDYLACPYRFYLKHILKLRPLDDQAKELDAPAFGSLLHDVLHRFGQSEVRSSRYVDEIRDFLRQTLDLLARETYGTQRLPAVNVQLRQLAARLDAFADWQAEWVRQGWTIDLTEWSPREEVPRLVPDEDRSIELVGRIDRIDRRGDEWFLFDYKSSDSVKTPDKVHRKSKAWIDLQLPLYRLLVKPLNLPIERLSLGYILLPKDLTKTGLSQAEWTDAEFAEAEAVALDVARRVLDQEFWPPSDPAPMLLSEFGPICQEGVL